jgi:hypothetical protein
MANAFCLISPFCVCLQVTSYLFHNQLSDFHEIWYGRTQGRNWGVGGGVTAAARRSKINFVMKIFKLLSSTNFKLLSQVKFLLRAAFVLFVMNGERQRTDVTS